MEKVIYCNLVSCTQLAPAWSTRLVSQRNHQFWSFLQFETHKLDWWFIKYFILYLNYYLTHFLWCALNPKCRTPRCMMFYRFISCQNNNEINEMLWAYFDWWCHQRRCTILVDKHSSWCTSVQWKYRPVDLLTLS